MHYKAILLTIDPELGYEGKYVSVHSFIQRSQLVEFQAQDHTLAEGNIF